MHIDRRMMLTTMGLGAISALNPGGLATLDLGKFRALSPRHKSRFPTIDPSKRTNFKAEHHFKDDDEPKTGKLEHHHKHPHKKAQSMRAMHTLDTPGNRRVLALTMWGEARGFGEGGMLAVGCVILNRAKQNHRFYGFGVEGVCTKRKQFSCWNKGDPNRARMDKLPDMKESSADWKAWVVADQLAAKLLTGTVKDITGGATFYCAEYMTPYWRNDMIIVGIQYGHAFYVPKKHLFRKKKKKTVKRKCRSSHHGHRHHDRKYHGRTKTRTTAKK